MSFLSRWFFGNKAREEHEENPDEDHEGEEEGEEEEEWEGEEDSVDEEEFLERQLERLRRVVLDLRSLPLQPSLPSAPLESLVPDLPSSSSSSLSSDPFEEKEESKPIAKDKQGGDDDPFMDDFPSDTEDADFLSSADHTTSPGAPNYGATLFLSAQNKREGETAEKVHERFLGGSWDQDTSSFVGQRRSTNASSLRLLQQHGTRFLVSLLSSRLSSPSPAPSPIPVPSSSSSSSSRPVYQSMPSDDPFSVASSPSSSSSSSKYGSIVESPSSMPSSSSSSSSSAKPKTRPAFKTITLDQFSLSS